MQTKNSHFVRFLTLSAVLWTIGLSAFAQQPIALSNKHVRLDFHAGRGDLLSLVDSATQMNFVSDIAGENAVWQIDMLPGTFPHVVIPSMAKSFRMLQVPNHPDELRLVWEDFNLPFSDPLRVEVTISLGQSKAMSYWSIAIQKPGEMHVEKVRFPRIHEIARQPRERLAVPQWMGEITSIPRALITGPNNPMKRLEWPYPGTMSLQCLAYYRENGPGLYLSCDDTAAYRKAFAFWGDSTGSVNYEMINYPENESQPQRQYSPRYHAVIGTFRGDWITAAEEYRSWGTKQPWALHSRLNLGLVPEWLLKTSLWVWNRGKSDIVLDPAVDLQKELKLPVSVFWHWWHGCSYDAGFPEYLPPREGTDHFKSALAAAYRSDIHAIVYMNQRLWGMTTESWLSKGAERFAVKGLDGTVRPEIYNTYTQQACATMCMATPFWRNTYASIAQEAVRDLGVDGIYMDQACSSLLCYDPTHGHPLGGGTFWMNGFRLLSSDIRQRTRSVRNTLLAGEGAGEAWLPYLDLMLTLQVSKERYARPNDGWDCIPFFQAVYHACGVTYGNYSSLTIPPYDELWPKEYAPSEPLKLLDQKYSPLFYIEQARTFAWGSQPTIANYLPLQRKARAEELAFALKLVRIREQATKYLLYGTFLRPPSYSTAAIEYPVIRLSIYAGRKARPAEVVKKPSSDDGIDDSGHDKSDNVWQSTTPPLILGAWRAKDNSVGIAVANISNTQHTFVFDASTYGFTNGDQVHLITATERRLLMELGNSKNVKLDIPAKEAFVVEVSKK
jgi:hypothetical protein